ncbi:unnamed protein product [Effrenium voratum]|uniref:Uncharacterized protein n=2 Tax=Effrenium voratum TaxID=2562239 RepID=A0AA36INB4_9DINO|nr:unnamed protein product [Effrenium voratum]CAJ1443086.1 unnamed protein product [Effrenium voratum]
MDDANLHAAKLLHQRVPACRWCITLKEFNEFVRDVRVEWKAGRVPDSASHPNPSHDDPDCGPNMYQVNQHFVKPCTLRAGGMSYALMKHPDGLECEVFISHAWAEGVFELSSSVAGAWVPGMHNLYCCLLANPQNLDIGELLGCRPSLSPFAAALGSASHIIVAPNRAVSVYSRLWCVYEAYLAANQEKVFLIPSRQKASRCFRYHFWWIFLPVLCGFAIACCLWKMPLAKQQSFKRHLLTVLTVLTILNLMNLLLAGLWPRHCPKPAALWVLDSFMLFTYTLVASGYFLILPPYLTDDLVGEYWSRRALIVFFRVFLIAALAFLSMGIVGHNITNSLDRAALRALEQGLNFDSVRFATCSNPKDAAAIWGEISDSVSDVDAAIHILVRAGAYTRGLRQQFDAGVDIQGAGFTDFCIRTVHASALWLVATVAMAERGYFWAEHVDIPKWLWVVPVVVCGAASCAIPPTLFRIVRRAPEHGVFACQVMSTCGILTILAPTFWVVEWSKPATLQHLVGATPLATQWKPPTPLALFLAVYPLIMATCCLLLVWLGPTLLWSGLVQTRKSTCDACISFSRGKSKSAESDFDSDEESDSSFSSHKSSEMSPHASCLLSDWV